MGCKSSTAANKGAAAALPPPSKPTVTFVLGGPGSGKGTQCERVSKEYDLVHLSAGDLLRAERNSGSEKADLINSYIRDGKIVPVEITVGLIRAAIEKSVADGRMYFLVDGFPRDKENVRGWKEKMDGYAEVAFILFLECSEKCMEERLLERGKTSGRADDNAESIRKRFNTFQADSMPVVEEFEKEGKVRRINSERPIDEVYASVKAVFDEEIKKRSAGAAEEKKDEDAAPGVQTTFAWAKPDVVSAGKDEEFIAAVRAAGFEIVEQRKFQPGRELIEEFYAEHKGKPFYDGLVDFMTGGEAVALALRKDNAIKAWRATLGPTNSHKAREESPDSLRAKFGTDGSQNAGHGSDSVESANRELGLVFPDKKF